MNDENQNISTQMDDNTSGGPTEQQLLDAVLAGSEFYQEASGEVPLPDEQLDDVDPDESEIPDPDEEEAVSEDEEEEYEYEEDENEGEDDEDSTQEPDIYTAEDLDLDAQVAVKIDGEETTVSFADLIKGYQTDAHLSKKGRELSEAREAIEAERNERLGQLEQMSQGVAGMLMQQEQAHAKDYHDIEAKIKEARENGDTYEVNELKDKREQAQMAYHNAKKQREGLMNAVQQHQQQKEVEEWNSRMHYFTETIPTLIPDFNEEVAGQIREFALDYGFSQEFLDTITDPVAVKMVDEFRRLKQGVAKGAQKRKKAPAKKAIPARKAKPASKKKADAAAKVRQRGLSENATEAEQMAFLRNMASNTLSNL